MKAREVADQLSPLELHAHVSRLRSLHTHLPELDGIDQLIDIIAPPNPGSQTSDHPS